MFLYCRMEARHTQERLWSFCPLIMSAGRPRKFDPGTLHWYATHFYWDLKNLQEGRGWRAAVNWSAREKLTREVEDSSRLTPAEIAELERRVDEQIQKWNLPSSSSDEQIQHVRGEIEGHRRLAGQAGAWDSSQKWVPVPGEPQIIEKLLRARTSEQIQKFCADAFIPVNGIMRPNWPISGESKLPSALSQYASEFIEAKNDPRFPKSGRPTSRIKQIWFLARALSGAMHGLKTRTAINLIGSVRPDEGAMLSKISKRSRRPKKSTRKQS